MATRVLVMQSVQDDITERRIWRMRESPLLRDCEFSNIFAIQISEEERELHPFEMMRLVEQRPLDRNALSENLEASIKAFVPDVLIIHAGFAFHRFTDDMLDVLRMSKENHPNLPFALEGCDEFLESRYAGLFTTDPQFLLIADRVFGR